MCRPYCAHSMHSMNYFLPTLSYSQIFKMKGLLQMNEKNAHAIVYMHLYMPQLCSQTVYWMSKWKSNSKGKNNHNNCTMKWKCHSMLTVQQSSQCNLNQLMLSIPDLQVLWRQILKNWLKKSHGMTPQSCPKAKEELNKNGGERGEGILLEKEWWTRSSEKQDLTVLCAYAVLLTRTK